jgi:hypothetical protein
VPKLLLKHQHIRRIGIESKATSKTGEVGESRREATKVEVLVNHLKIKTTLTSSKFLTLRVKTMETKQIMLCKNKRKKGLTAKKVKHT